MTALCSLIHLSLHARTILSRKSEADFHHEERERRDKAVIGTIFCDSSPKKMFKDVWSFPEFTTFQVRQCSLFRELGHSMACRLKITWTFEHFYFDKNRVVKAFAERSFFFFFENPSWWSEFDWISSGYHKYWTLKY